MGLILGRRAESLIVLLNPGFPFYSEINTVEYEPPYEPWLWPVGASADLHLDKGAFSVVWAGVVEDSYVSWSATANQVNAVPNRAIARIYVNFPGVEGSPFLWASGIVKYEV